MTHLLVATERGGIVGLVVATVELVVDLSGIIAGVVVDGTGMFFRGLR